LNPAHASNRWASSRFLPFLSFFHSFLHYPICPTSGRSCAPNRPHFYQIVKNISVMIVSYVD
jgi:hypothetical protein